MLLVLNSAITPPITFLVLFESILLIAFYLQPPGAVTKVRNKLTDLCGI